MNGILLITLTVVGLFSTVNANCDPSKCVSFLEAIDKSDPKQICPALKTVSFCLKDLFATCPTLESDSRTILEGALVDINEKINNACVEVFPTTVEINTMAVTTARPASNEVQSDDAVGIVGGVLGTLLGIALIVIVVSKFKRTKSDNGTKSSKIQPDVSHPDRNPKPVFVHS